MRISKKAEYGLRAVVAMARTPQKLPVPIQELSRTARVPVKFLEQILLILKRGGILKSKRGVGGGYQLEKRPADISLGEIVRLIDGHSVLMSCAAAVPPARKAAAAGPCECGEPGGCGLGKSFARLQDLVAAYLDGQSIQDVLALERLEDALAFEI
jgi:Rrf2 family protein